MAQRPLGRMQDKFVDGMVHNGDPKIASIEAGYAPNGHWHLLKNPRILEEIQRRKDMVNHEKAALTAKKQVVNVDALDERLMHLVNSDPRQIPALGSSIARALRLGYERAGILVDNTFIPDQPPPSAQPAESRIFRASEARILTHTIETRQEVVQRSVTAEPAQPESRYKY